MLNPKPKCMRKQLLNSFKLLNTINISSLDYIGVCSSWVECSHEETSIKNFFFLLKLVLLNYCMSDMTNLWHKIIFKRHSEKKEENYSYLSKLLKIELHLVTITNTQNKVHYAYLFFSCGNSEKLNLKLWNLIF